MAFDYKFPVSSSDPACKSSFTRSFQHKDWVDGQDVVQGGQTANEDGFNLRFHKIEADIDALSANLATAFNCINVLRAQLAEVLTEIKTQFNLPPAKTSKEGKDVKDFKDGKDAKDQKDAKDGKDTKDAKDGKDGKDTKDGKDGKDGKDAKDGKDHKDGKDGKDGAEKNLSPNGLFAIEKSGRQQEFLDLPKEDLAMHEFLWAEAPKDEPVVGRSFILPDERPPVGERQVGDL